MPPGKGNRCPFETVKPRTCVGGPMSPLPAPGPLLAVGAGAAGLRVVMAAILVAAAVGAAYAGWRALGNPSRSDSAASGSQRMSLLDHVEELRRRVLSSLAVVLLGAVFAFSFRLERTAGGWWVPHPAVSNNLAAQAFRIVRDHLVPANVQLVVTRPVDAVAAELAIALGLGVALAMPVLVWNAGQFLLPALRPRERRAMAQLLVPVLALFAAGAAFAWVVVLPFLLATLYGYADPLGATPLLRIGDLVSFAVGLILAFGLAFQMPIVMYGLARAGLVSARGFWRAWRHALVAILIVSALATDPTVVSQVIVAGPLFGLYLSGAVLAAAGERGFKRASR